MLKILVFVLIIIIANSFFILSAFSQEKELEELLDLNLEDLMNIEVVTATKQAQKISEVPATVRVITAGQIKERGYFTLDDAFADLPGFQFRNIVGFNSYSFMRGVPSQNQTILIMVDGILINELNSGGFYGGGQYNLSNVKAIEIVYGPASALYGTNALSGIVNLITNDPQNAKGGKVSLLAGSFATKNIDFSLGNYNEDKDFGFVISGMLKQSEKADLAGEKGDDNWTENMENFEDDISFDGKIKYKNFEGGFVFQDKQASRSTNYKSVGTDYIDSGTKWHIRFLNGHIRYNHDFNGKIFSQSQLYYRNASVADNTIGYIKSATGDKGGQVGYYRPNNLIGFENQFTYKPNDKSNVIAGVVREEERLAEGFTKSYSGSPDIKPSPPEKPGVAANHLTSIFLQTQYKFISAGEVTFGLRHDNSSIYGKVNTPRLGLVLSKDKLTTKLLYMKAFRAPKPWDYTYGIGNPDLEPESMRSLELAAIYVFSNNLKTDVTLFNTDIDDKFINQVEQVINGGRLKTNGIETSLDFARGRFKANLNYTYLASKFENGDDVPEIAKNNANIGITYSLSNSLIMNLRGNYLGKRKSIKTISASGKDFVDASFIINSTFSFFNYKNFDFQIIVRNLLNTEYYHTSNRPPDRYRQPQRTILFKTGYRF